MNRHRLSIAVALIITVVSLAVAPIAYAVRNGVQYAQQYYRPIIGGIQIDIWYQMNSNGICYLPLRYGYCTIGYSVRAPNGSLGFITAGHCTDFSTSWSSGDRGVTWYIFQPSSGVSNDMAFPIQFNWNNYVGSPSFVAPRSLNISNPLYDWEFVPYSNVAPYVLYATNSTSYQYYIYGTFASYDTIVQMLRSGGRIPVAKTGRSTGTTTGYINDYYNYCIERDTQGTIIAVVRRCLISSGDGNLYAEPGDSGAPVFFVYTPGVFILGNIIGGNSTQRITVIESIDNVIELGYRLYTIYDATYGH